MRIAALLLGAIEAPHEASSQLARASEVTWKWSVISLLRVLNILLQSVTSHDAHALGTRVIQGMVFGGSHTLVLPVSHL